MKRGLVLKWYSTVIDAFVDAMNINLKEMTSIGTRNWRAVSFVPGAKVFHTLCPSALQPSALAS